MTIQQSLSCRPFALRLLTDPITPQPLPDQGTYDPQRQMSVTADGTLRIATSYARSDTSGGWTSATELERIDFC
ncbi:putative ATP-grasp-modified RiPP [Streptomyces rimosus]|uniref:putative ATP-grasp-modified RiPP n=1 Tax=Streptomyces rimosus TaxID=1927 RepID=UPI0004BEAA96|nr:putative ATP-grasp-modified RiPP [Streptomyces rimosus]